MKVINFFGGPSSGKSTSAAYVFSYLKQHNVHCEYINQYAKDCVYENRLSVLKNDQLYILAKQNHKIKMLELSKQAEYAIVDSPLILSNIYGQLYHSITNLFKQMTLELFNSYENINLFMKRNLNFEQNGRIQNKYESENVDLMIKNYLIENKIPFTEVKNIKLLDIDEILNCGASYGN